MVEEITHTPCTEQLECEPKAKEKIKNGFMKKSHNRRGLLAVSGSPAHEELSILHIVSSRARSRYNPYHTSFWPLVFGLVHKGNLSIQMIITYKLAA